MPQYYSPREGFEARNEDSASLLEASSSSKTESRQLHGSSRSSALSDVGVPAFHLRRLTGCGSLRGSSGGWWLPGSTPVGFRTPNGAVTVTADRCTSIGGATAAEEIEFGA